MHIESEGSDDKLNAAVYAVLLALTGATVGAGVLAGKGRLMAVAVALIIASVKASLIAFYYMGLRRERALTWLLLGVGAAAVLALFIGIVPDLTFARL